MLRVAIIDACFSLNKQSAQGLAALWLRYQLQGKAKVVEPHQADVILVTLVSPEQARYIERVRDRYPGKAVVAGGAASCDPYWLGRYADAVCVGDGQEFLDVLCSNGLDSALELPNAWIDKRDFVVEIDQGFPWSCPPIQAEDKAYRVWMGRGCKNKCFFCPTGWSQEYQEHPEPEKLIQQINVLRAQGKKVAYLSNDPSQHSFIHRLPAIDHGSFSFRFIRKHGLPKARQVRMGVEGVSERLRKYVNKPISTDDLVKCTAWLNHNGVGVRWFMIAGLPTEKREDWEELKEAVQRWKRMTNKGVLGLSFTAFCPHSSTPLGIMPVSDEYFNFWTDFKDWFFGGRGWSNRVKLMHPQQPGNRIKKAEWTTGLSESELRSGGNWGPHDRLAYPFKGRAKRIGNRLYAKCGIEEEEV